MLFGTNYANFAFLKDKLFFRQMKKLFLVVMICVMGIIGFVAFKFLNENERRVSPQATATIKTENLDLNINYSRPYKNGRAIFGNVVKYGEYWRTGADEATEISFGKRVKFGDEEVNPGTYRLYTIPEKDEWIIALNSELGQWGAFEPNYDLDVVRIKITPNKLDKIVDQLTLRFETSKNGVDLLLSWDDTQVTIPIQ